MTVPDFQTIMLPLLVFASDGREHRKAAVEYARNIESSIILIGGETLSGLMIDHDVGVTLETSYEVKRIDSDYFDEV